MNDIETLQLYLAQQNAPPIVIDALTSVILHINVLENLNKALTELLALTTQKEQKS
jgi:hypothetical protein